MLALASNSLMLAAPAGSMSASKSRKRGNDGTREGLQVLGMFDLPENRTH